MDSEGSDEEDASSSTLQATSTFHLSSLTQIDTIDLHGVIPLSRFELEDDDHQVSILKSIGRFVRKYFFCITTRESFEGQEEATSESIDEGQRFESDNSTHGNFSPQFRALSTQPNSRAKQQRNHRFNSVSKVILILKLNVTFKFQHVSRLTSSRGSLFRCCSLPSTSCTGFST